MRFISSLAPWLLASVAKGSFMSEIVKQAGILHQGPPKQSDSLIVMNAMVTTLDENNPTAEAVVVENGEFKYVGTNEEAMNHKTDETTVIDANGRRLVPGLNDSHMHPTRGARLYHLELRWDGVKSLEEGLQMVKEQAARTPEGQWVRVIGGWSPYQFAEKRMPTTEELDEAAPNTPVFLLHLYSGGFLNSKGLEALGIDKDTPDFAKGRYERDADGNPTGVLTGAPEPNILYATVGSLPTMNVEEELNSALYFYTKLLELGVTSVVDAGGGGHYFPGDYGASQSLAEMGELPLRVSFFLFPQTPGKTLEDFRSWVKIYNEQENSHVALEDGYTLEGGGELLVYAASDYENFRAARPDLADNAEEELKAVVEVLVKNKWPIRIHATYDESIQRILSVFEEVNQYYPLKDVRWIIDHAETISAQSLERVKTLGGGIAIQDRMYFAGEDFVDQYGAEMASNAPPIRDIMDLGIPLGAGTDGTRVSSFNTWYGIHWLVSGKTIGGMEVAADKNKLTREEALKLYTMGAAWMSGEEHLKGLIAPGQYADFILLTADYMTIPEDEIANLKSVLTVVGGKIEYGAEEFDEYKPLLPPVNPEWSPTAYFDVFGG